MRLQSFFLSFLLVSALAAKASAEPPQGRVATTRLTSAILADNRIGLSTERQLSVYLPPGYATSGKRYPVVYLLHNFFRRPAQVFEDGNVQRVVERAFASGVVGEFILVAPDYSGPTTGSMFENSPVSGRWLDHTVQEVVPFIDGRYRTLPDRDSRAVIGEFFGGRGALQLAMSHAATFGVAYALHPVATGRGDLPWSQLAIDWSKLHASPSFAALEGSGTTQLFFAIHQAFSPKPDHGACHCEFFMKRVDDQVSPDAATMRRMQKVFMLDGTLEQSAANLRTLRGLALDWARFDTVQAHVRSNREFSTLLEDLGIAHEAEEYRGDPWSRNWTPDGRFATRVLPFLRKHLVFAD